MSEKSTDPFADALADLFTPLARAMIARGLTLASVTESMKQALLSAAIETEGADVSDSRISVMTGVHRKDVRRLRFGDRTVPGHKTANRMALLIGCWTTVPDFQGDDDKPRALHREADEHGPGFDDLVSRVRLDAAPGTILRILLDQGAVQEDPDGRLSLMTDAMLPAAGSAELVAAYHATLSAHLAAATHNFLAAEDDRRHFDRVVRYSHLSDTSVAELEDRAKSGAQRLLEMLNARARELQEEDADRNAKGKFTTGVFVLPTPDTNEEEAE